MELARFPSRGGFSVRSIFTFALAVISTVLLWAIFTSTPASAADAVWSNDTTILYDNNRYSKVDSVNDTSGTIPNGSSVYRSPTQSSTSGSQKVFILYFTPGVDPPTATTAQYVEFDVSSTNSLSNPSNKASVALAAQSTDLSEVKSSCSVGGIGWIVCPVSIWLAEGMDWLFGILSSLVAVQPLTLGDTNDSMYSAWSIARTIANIAFVIAFLIIIYSQLTNVGLSSYGLKRLIPRLIVAAVLVNLSYYITALAIDISNVLGYSVQDTFNGIREQIFSVTNDDLSGANTDGGWAAIAAIALAGGGYLGASYIVAGGATFFLVPLLIGLALTALFVILILAARQAIIIILVVVAPLAFVAYLLPNTEKWFEKWKDLFMTMLIFFPAFSLVFGGSQLAGQIIIQNAGDNFIMMIFGMAVQIAPLVITPLILKLSGGLLGKIAQIANNPRKGLIDRSRGWAGEHAEIRRNKTYANRRDGNAFVRAMRPGAGVRFVEGNRRSRQKQIALQKQRADNAWETSARAERLNLRMEEATDDKTAIHNHHTQHADHLRRTAGTPLNASGMRVQQSKQDMEAEQQRLATYYNEQRLNGGALNASFTALETSKTLFEASEQDKTAYLSQQKSYRVTQLGAAAERLEAAKLTAEGMQGRYTAHIDDLKLNPTSGLGDAARFALTGKDHAEAAQGRVQAVFDRERATPGTALYYTTVEVERVKAEMDRAKSQLTETISTLKSTKGTPLHAEVMETERTKLAAQRAEGRLTRTIEEYKSGAIDPATLTAQEQTIMQQMAEENARIAAEQRGATSAKYVQQEYISSLMDEDSVVNPALTAELLDIAAGVDPNGRTRAQANAISQLDKLESEALNNSVTLLGDRAEKQSKTIKSLAKEIFQKHTGTFRDAAGNLLPREQQDPSIIEAALEALAKDGDVATLRKARMQGGPAAAGGVDQEMLTRLLARNSGTMKVKGGFDLQNDPSLAGATQQRMDASTAAMLGSTAAEDYIGMKNSAIVEYAKRFDEILANSDAETDPAYKANAMEGLQKSYFNLTKALNDPQIVRRLGDNLTPAITMHEKLHARYGRQPDMTVDYDAIRPDRFTPKRP